MTARPKVVRLKSIAIGDVTLTLDQVEAVHAAEVRLEQAAVDLAARIRAQLNPGERVMMDTPTGDPLIRLFMTNHGRIFEVRLVTDTDTDTDTAQGDT